MERTGKDRWRAARKAVMGAGVVQAFRARKLSEQVLTGEGLNAVEFKSPAPIKGKKMKQAHTRGQKHAQTHTERMQTCAPAHSHSPRIETIHIAGANPLFIPLQKAKGGMQTDTAGLNEQSHQAAEERKEGGARDPARADPLQVDREVVVMNLPTALRRCFRECRRAREGGRGRGQEKARIETTDE